MAHDERDASELGLTNASLTEAGYAWRSGTAEAATKNITRHCARTYVSESMQDVRCDLPPVPLSPTFITAGAQIQQCAFLIDEDETVPEVQGQRLALEQEVANLKEKLTHEVNLREALTRGLQRSLGTLPKIPGGIPAKTRELLFEVAVLEEEVTFLEKHAVYLRQELHDETEPAASPSTQDNDKELTTSMRPPTLKIDIPEFSEPSTSTEFSELATPFMTPLVTPTTLDNKPSPRSWTPSAASSPLPRHEGNIPLPLPLPPAFALPLPVPLPSPSPPLVQAEESNSVPPQTLNRKRVIRRGSSSSESLPADLGEPTNNVVRKPSRKKPNHKKSASLTSLPMKKVALEGNTGSAKPSLVRKDVDRGDVYLRLSAPRSGGYVRGSPLPSPPANLHNPGYATLRRSTSMKEIQGNHPCLTSPSPPPALLDNSGGKNSLRRSTGRKELHGRSPPVASPQFEDKKVAFMRRSYSSKELQAGGSPASNPSPRFEDKGISSVKRTVSPVIPIRSPHMKMENHRSLPSTPTPEKHIQDRLMTTFKLPPPMEKENFKVPAASDRQLRAHDLVSKSLPRIKLTKAPNEVSNLYNTPGAQEGLHQRKTSEKDGEKNNFFENAKLYVQANARSKLPGMPTKQGFKVRPVQVQKAASKVVDRQPTASNLKDNAVASRNKLDDGDFHDDEKDDKVGMVCGPMADAAWLSEDLARILGTICSKIRRPNPAPEPAPTHMVAKPPLPLLGGSQRIQQFQRSHSFDIRSSGGLKLLQEYCSDDMDLSENYGESRNRRTEGVGPHRHYYKAIKLPHE